MDIKKMCKYTSFLFIYYLINNMKTRRIIKMKNLELKIKDLVKEIIENDFDKDILITNAAIINNTIIKYIFDNTKMYVDDEEQFKNQLIVSILKHSDRFYNNNDEFISDFKELIFQTGTDNYFQYQFKVYI